MSKFTFVLLLSVLLLSCKNENSNAENGRVPDNMDSQQGNIPDGASALITAYPDFITRYEDGKIVFADKSRMTYDDGKAKTFVKKLDNADVEDMFSIEYTADYKVPGYCDDPGRIRCDALFRKMYGNSQAEVSKNLKTIDWFGTRIRFSRINGAIDSLRKVQKELLRHPEYKKYLTSSSSFYWRNVRGSDRLSAHSYGIAIDINTKYSNFWLWSNPGKTELDRNIAYKNQIPLGIVRIFAKHGFIWGGEWYHFDTMHFEFRPELLAYSKKHK